MFRSLFRKLRLRRAYRKRLPDSRWAQIFQTSEIPLDAIGWDTQTRRPILLPFQLKLEAGKDDFVVRSFSSLLELNKVLPLSLRNQDGEIIISIGDVSLPVETKQEILTIIEVFLNGDYDIRVSSPCVVMDVGFNIGLTSLFLAKKENIERVFGFEPVGPTYQKGMKVLESNPGLAKKIEVTQVGLGEKEEVLEVPYSYEQKGSVSTSHKVSLDGVGTTEKVQITPFTPKLEEIREAYPDHRIIAKIDCEGGEYGIFRDLEKSGKFSEIYAFMIEFHYEGTPFLTDLLHKNGFECVVFGDQKELGMIYAWKKSS
ncbi:MAG: FkbM family methyltransferase [Planctomycetota bacterium]|nr:FkbM family methyltransferase [Planctomycetota bacterium]